MLSLPIAFTSAIGVFAPVFSRPVWQHGEVLMTGAVRAPGKRTVTAILLTWFVQRWTLEVTFEEARAHLGMATQRQWNDRAIAPRPPFPRPAP